MTCRRCAQPKNLPDHQIREEHDEGCPKHHVSGVDGFLARERLRGLELRSIEHQQLRLAVLAVIDDLERSNQAHWAQTLRNALK